MPQSDDESLSITGRIVVRPGRTPNSSSAAVGGADSVEHSVTRSWVVSEVSVSSWASSGCSSGSISVQSGTRRSVSCSGIHRRPRSVSFSTTTCRFTRNVEHVRAGHVLEVADVGVRRRRTAARRTRRPTPTRRGRTGRPAPASAGTPDPSVGCSTTDAAVERDLEQRRAAGHEHARRLRSRLLQGQAVAVELDLAVQRAHACCPDSTTGSSPTAVSWSTGPAPSVPSGVARARRRPRRRRASRHRPRAPPPSTAPLRATTAAPPSPSSTSGVSVAIRSVSRSAIGADPDVPVGVRPPRRRPPPSTRPRPARRPAW